MRCTRTHSLLTTVLLALVLAGCGGGGGGGALADGGGIGGTGLHIGPNEGDGAVQVDGIAFDATAASITISGMNATETDVRDGMVVVVSGSVSGSTGTASSVEIEEVVKGRLEQKLNEAKLIVQGQTVEVDESTVFGPGISPASVDGLDLGDLLEIYGFVRRSGVAFATRIEREGSLSELRIHGIVSNVDTQARTFAIGTQAVDYSGADTSDLPGGVPADGQLVRVRGLSTLSPAGELVATIVKRADFEELDDASVAEIEGFVTEVLSPTRFRLGGHLVETNGETRFAGGTAAEIAVGVRLDARGTRLNDVLVAAKIQFRAAVKLESNVATVSGNTLTLVGLPGITVVVDGATEIEGQAATFADIGAGDHVEIRGRKSGPARVIAVLVKEEDADTTLVLQGPVDASPAPSDPTLAVLGVSIDTSGLQDADFRGANDLPIGRAAFFGTVTGGVLVKAEGDLAGTVADWDEIELEGEDD